MKKQHSKHPLRFLVATALLLTNLSHAQNYCMPISNGTSGEGTITQVSITPAAGTPYTPPLNNYTGFNNYTDYGYQVSNNTYLTSGLTYTINIKSSQSSPSVYYYYKAWIDYNKNGIFEFAELIANTYQNGYFINSNNTNVAQNFVIPSTIATKDTRMRVQLTYINTDVYNSCTDGSALGRINLGETEDYYVHLLCPPVPTPTITGNDYLCVFPADQTYGLIGVSQATYAWTLSGTTNMAVFHPDQTTYKTGNSVLVHIDQSYRNGYFTLQVQGTNVCGSKSGIATKSVTINTTAPAAFTGVYGPANVCNSGPVSFFQPKPLGPTSNVEWDITPASAVSSYLPSLYGQLNVDWNNSFVGYAQIRCRKWNGCGYNAWTPYKWVYVSSGTCGESNISRLDEDGSYEDIESIASLKVLPNPSTLGYVEIVGNPIENGSYQIKNLAGINVQSGLLTSTIDISSLNMGMYILNIFDSHQTIVKTEKIVKQ